MSSSHDTARSVPLATDFVVPVAPGPQVDRSDDVGETTGAPHRPEPTTCDRTRVWDVPFDCLTLTEAIDRIETLVGRGTPSYVITANLNYVMLHHRDRSIRPITEGAELILADGQPIVWRSKLGRDRLPERVAGSEMIYHLAERASRNGWGIYFLGGQPGVAATCAERLAKLYPGLRISGVESPPFRPLTPQEQAAQYDRIGRSGAKLLLVAFGQPKGERWIHQHYQRLGIPVCIQLGASFDFIAGTARRAPLIWQRLGLEWAHRMISDPRRLIPRYAANATFLASVLVEDWKRQVTRWGLGQWTVLPRGECLEAGCHGQPDRRRTPPARPGDDQCQCR